MTTHDHGLVETDVFAVDFARMAYRLHIAGAVISFDDRRLDQLLRSEGQIPSWHYHIIDIEALAAGFLAYRKQFQDTHDPEPGTVGEALPDLGPPWDSETLSTLAGIDPALYERHTALGDCRWAKAVYEAVLGPATVAFVDTETTGLHPELHQIWEVGLIRPDVSDPAGAEHRWFLPVDLSYADPFALDVGGFHRRHPHGYEYSEPG